MNFACCLLADTASSTVVRFSRLQTMSEWWHWLLLIACCAAVLGYVVFMYWRDSVELSRGVAWSLVMFRLLAFTGILFFFLDLEKRTVECEIKPSRAILLIDTSQSMSLKDLTADSNAPGPSRSEQVITELRGGQLLQQLRERHEVTVYRFDETAEPTEIAFFPRTETQTAQRDAADVAIAQKQQQLQTARRTMLIALALAGLAVVAFLAHWLLPRRARGRVSQSWAVLAGNGALAAALIIAAVASLRSGGLSLTTLVGLQDPDMASLVAAELAANGQPGAESETSERATVEPSEVAWQETLIPRGAKTRLGDAVRWVVTKERGGPIAGIVVLTDGALNAGVEAGVAARAATVAGIPVSAVGLGSEQQPVNVRVVDLEAPKRVYPGDKFSVSGYLQAFGLAGQRVQVELFSRAADAAVTNEEDPTEGANFEESQTIRLGEQGDVVTVRFEVTPNAEGNWLYYLKAVAPEQDMERRDNFKSARVQVVQRKSQILLLAGGPTREFQFLRNQLYRDSDTTVHMLLQSGIVGMSQEADEVLFDFPELADELFAYDCIVAFDFDWTQLDELQVELLDRFVAEQAGGLIVVAGPVYTPLWAGQRRGNDPRIDTIKALYPVVFYSQGVPSLGLGRFGGDAAWPLDFSRDGVAAEYLWLEDDPIDSEAAWQSFDGVFGYYAVKDPKPGARVLARFSNPDTSIDGELPIYLASHFYGAGRVFFQASGEMWRLRALDPRYFEAYYTKLLRWASQGRLLRDSSRGVLLLDKDRCLLGDQVTVRAALSDLQHRPLQVDSVPAILVQPDGQRVSLVLRKVQDAAREGMYETQFTTLLAGDYRVELSPAENTTDELLTAEVRVRLPTLEIENPQRDDTLLRDLTRQTGGKYYVGLDAAMNRGGAARATLASTLEPNDQIVYLPETVDSRFDEQLMGWLLALIVAVLACEWLIRRISRLA